MTEKSKRRRRERSVAADRAAREPQKPKDAGQAPLGTVSGDSLGSSPATPTHLGRDGDVLVDDTTALGRDESGLRMQTPPDEQARASAEQPDAGDAHREDDSETAREKE